MCGVVSCVAYESVQLVVRPPSRLRARGSSSFGGMWCRLVVGVETMASYRDLMIYRNRRRASGHSDPAVHRELGALQSDVKRVPVEEPEVERELSDDEELMRNLS